MAVLFKKYRFRCWLTSGLIFCNLVLPKVASGQVMPDGTTPTPEPGSCAVTCTITGGTTDSTGANLFHSFVQFSVPEGGIVVFDHEPTIRNIFTRVTGNELSSINGLLSTDISSNTNLFLLNPNGIVFGPNGGLDLGGSFVATTADAIQFGNQGAFSALDTTTDPALLTVDPSAFLFSQTTVAPIVNQANTFSSASFLPGLVVQENRSLLLVGGDIILEPLNEFGGNVIALSGRIELGGLDGAGVIGLDVNGNELRLTYEDNAPLANVSTNGVTLDVSDSSNGDAAGEIVIKANSFSSSNSFFNSETSSSEDAGSIVLHTNSSVKLQGTFIFSSTSGAGAGGTLEISTGSLTLDDFSIVLFGTFGTGDAGEILIEAETISLLGGSFITSEATSFSEPVGDAGQIQIKTDSLVLDGSSVISTKTTGDALNADASGNIVIEAQDFVALTEGSGIRSETLGQRNASSIQINTADLSIDNSFISAAVNEEGDEFSDATGQGGAITLETQLLSLDNNAEITSSTSGSGDAGNILAVGAESVTVSNDSTLSARSISAGAAGNLSVQTNGQLRVQNGGEVEVSGEGTGNSGMLKVIAETVVLDDGQLLASVVAGEDGNIELNAEDAVILRDDSLISAEAFNDANGGNVDITTPFIIALFPGGPNGNDIQASAIGGDGGRISIQANTLFGIEENQAIDGNMTNDIDASSEAGIDGEVIIETLEVDPDEGTDPLPSGLAEPEISQGCQASDNGQFIATRQGGLRPNPYEPLSSADIQEDIYPVGQTTAQLEDTGQADALSERSSQTIIEAQGWGRNVGGDVVLLAETPMHSFCQRALTGAS